MNKAGINHVAQDGGGVAVHTHSFRVRTAGGKCSTRGQRALSPNRPAARITNSACPTRRIGYNHCESPATVPPRRIFDVGLSPSGTPKATRNEIPVKSVRNFEMKAFGKKKQDV